MKFRYTTKEKIKEIPKVTGVYALAADKEILYIGKAVNILERVKNHFAQPVYQDVFFINQITRVGYIPTSSEIEALLLESVLIKEYNPKYNVMWKDGKGYFFVGITAEELPRVFITHQPRAEAQKSPNSKHKTTYVGPFTDGKALKRTLRYLRKIFPYYTTKKHGSKPCQYCHLKLCPGPAPDKKQYLKNIKNLKAILEGKETFVAKNLEHEMNKASKNQDFERAAELRDQLFSFQNILAHASIFADPLEDRPFQIAYAETEKKLREILQITPPIKRIEAYDISNIQGQQSTGSMVVFVNGKPAKDQYRKFKIIITGKPNDFAMMRETISRRLKHPEWEYPQLMIIDGGKGQLTSALSALRNFEFRISNFEFDSKLKIQNSEFKRIAVAAIAKKHNELYLPGNSKPILLSTLCRGVFNLILHIRDESHRFAITYHRVLRRKNLLS